MMTDYGDRVEFEEVDPEDLVETFQEKLADGAKSVTVGEYDVIRRAMVRKLGSIAERVGKRKPARAL